MYSEHKRGPIILHIGIAHKRPQQLRGEEGSKMGQNLLTSSYKNFQHGEGDLKNQKEMPTFFMDDSYVQYNWPSLT